VSNDGKGVRSAADISVEEALLRIEKEENTLSLGDDGDKGESKVKSAKVLLDVEDTPLRQTQVKLIKGVYECDPNGEVYQLSCFLYLFNFNVRLSALFRNCLLAIVTFSWSRSVVLYLTLPKRERRMKANQLRRVVRLMNWMEIVRMMMSSRAYLSTTILLLLQVLLHLSL
jgi:hypothetical protein